MRWLKCLNVRRRRRRRRRSLGSSKRIDIIHESLICNKISQSDWCLVNRVRLSRRGNLKQVLANATGEGNLRQVLEKTVLVIYKPYEG